jgi:hypothetical protein
MGRGISFVPWDSLQDSNQKRSVWERCFMAGHSHLPSGALVRDFTIEKRHIHQDEYQRDMEKYMTLVDATELHDALMCIALVGPFAPHVVASWISFPPWAPMFGGSMMLPQLEGFSSTQPFPEDASVGARSLFDAFSALPVNLQARLRLVMQRLNRAMRRFVPVDASIDLGIALEALYLSDMSDDRGELTFRLKTRAARLLGTSGADRKRLFTLVGDLYGMRSSAVHTGVVASTIRGRLAQEVLAEGFSITAETARRFITDQEPNWDNVMFG